jgi:hypothetical protein
VLRVDDQEIELRQSEKFRDAGGGPGEEATEKRLARSDSPLETAEQILRFAQDDRGLSLRKAP